jgi:hypothetical protein
MMNIATCQSYETAEIEYCCKRKFAHFWCSLSSFLTSRRQSQSSLCHIIAWPKTVAAAGGENELGESVVVWSFLSSSF